MSSSAAVQSESAVETAQLRIERVSVRFHVNGSELRVLDDISLEVTSGERLMLLGPAGCGKSTLLKTIAGFQVPDEGTIRLQGRVVRDPGPDRFVVFQEFDQLFPWRNVRDNVIDCLRLTRGLSRAVAQARAAETLEMVGLTPYAKFFPHTLSGGMKQRVAIARAWATEPTILLMDEPFAALDAMTRATLQDETLNIWRRARRTLIFVTHSIDEALYLGTKIAVMGRSPGRILEMIDNPFSERRDDAGSIELRHRIRKLLGTVSA
ncbi:MAG TPA: ABC transporter ATP-binding protein [Candidatus Acidoferrales bacterium]|nr:ABC transporter ATP-binding protein [Candidatus Acidoferrales bacterium]